MKYQERKTIWKDSTSATRFTVVLLALYFIALLWILLFKLGVRFSYMETRIINLVPFQDAFMAGRTIDLPEVILNVVIFVPLGIYWGLLFQHWSALRKLLFFFFVSLSFETIQFILSIGAFDITDLITNTFGATTGLGMFTALRRVTGNVRRTHHIINVAATLGTVSMITLLFLLRMNMLPIRYQ